MLFLAQGDLPWSCGRNGSNKQATSEEIIQIKDGDLKEIFKGLPCKINHFKLIII